MSIEVVVDAVEEDRVGLLHTVHHTSHRGRVDVKSGCVIIEILGIEFILVKIHIGESHTSVKLVIKFEVCGVCAQQVGAICIQQVVASIEVSTCCVFCNVKLHLFSHGEHGEL